MPDERRKANTDLRTHGNKHVAFAVRNVDEVAEQLRARNADIEFVGHFPHGDNIFIRDNAGNLVEFVQEPGFVGDRRQERALSDEGHAINRLLNKVALVTGAGSGIGRGCALMFARHGAQVMATDLDEAGLRRPERRR